MYGFFVYFCNTFFYPALQMAPKSLDILRKGLKSLQNSITVKRDHLLTQLAEKKSITSLDKHWLNNDANLVNKEYILDTLEKASNYKRGVERLNNEGKANVIRLWELSSDLSLKVSKKQKCELLVKLTCYLKLIDP